MSTKRIYANGKLLRARRHEHRLSVRELARHGGTTFTTVNFIETNDAISNGLSLAEADKIARTVGLTLPDLLTPPPEAHLERLQSGTPRQLETTEPLDATRLASILIEADGLIPAAELCRVFGWTFTRLRAAQYQLDQLLRASGLRVHSNAMGVGLRPEMVEREGNRRLAELLDKKRRGLTVSEARLLRDAIIAVVPDEIRDGEKPAVGALVNLGLLKPGGYNEPATLPTEAAMFAFDVDGVTHDDLPVKATWKIGADRFNLNARKVMTPTRRNTRAEDRNNNPKVRAAATSRAKKKTATQT